MVILSPYLTYKSHHFKLQFSFLIFVTILAGALGNTVHMIDSSSESFVIFLRQIRDKTPTFVVTNKSLTQSLPEFSKMNRKVIFFFEVCSCFGRSVSSARRKHGECPCISTLMLHRNTNPISTQSLRNCLSSHCFFFPPHRARTSRVMNLFKIPFSLSNGRKFPLCTPMSSFGFHGYADVISTCVFKK